jgi:hypothetical protein
MIVPTSKKTMEIIEQNCLKILQSLREGKFSRYDLEFLLKFFKEIVGVTERMLDTPLEEKGKENE